MNGSQILLKTLKKNKVDTIFGIVGREAEVISFTEIKGIDFILTRDERNAAFMAEMKGRLTGKVGVCYSTFGPGATNLVTGIASAYVERIPLLAISAQVEQDEIHPSTHQYLDQVEIMKPLTKYSKQITCIDDLQFEIEKAINIAQSNLPGPSYLSIPLNILKQTGTWEKKKLGQKAVNLIDYRTRIKQKKKSNVSQLVKVLLKSQYPVCIIGGEIKDSREIFQIQKVLTFLGIPVVTTYRGKGIVNIQQENYLCTVSKYLDKLCPGVLKKIFYRSDLILLVGCDMVEGLNKDLWAYGKKKFLCSVNSLLHNHNQQWDIDLVLEDSYKVICSILKYNIKKKFLDNSQLSALKGQITLIKRNQFSRILGLSAYSVVRILNQTLKADDILVCDVGLHKQYLSLFYESLHPKGFFCSNGLGCMGFALPAAIGAKKVYPKKNVIAVCGDGGFYISSSALETCQRCHLPIVCIMICDSSVGLIRYYQQKGFGKINSKITHFGKTDYLQLVKANGFNTYHPKNEKDFKKALTQAMKKRTSSLIQISLDQKNY